MSHHQNLSVPEQVSVFTELSILIANIKSEAAAGNQGNVISELCKLAMSSVALIGRENELLANALSSPSSAPVVGASSSSTVPAPAVAHSVNSTISLYGNSPSMRIPSGSKVNGVLPLSASHENLNIDSESFGVDSDNNSDYGNNEEESTAVPKETQKKPPATKAVTEVKFPPDTQDIEVLKVLAPDRSLKELEDISNFYDEAHHDAAKILMAWKTGGFTDMNEVNDEFDGPKFVWARMVADLAKKYFKERIENNSSMAVCEGRKKMNNATATKKTPLEPQKNKRKQPNANASSKPKAKKKALSKKKTANEEGDGQGSLNTDDPVALREMLESRAAFARNVDNISST